MKKNKLTESKVASIFPFGLLPNVVSFKLTLTWFAADEVAAPLWGFVASKSTLREAMA